MSGDNLFVVFDSCYDALIAACEMRAAVNLFSKGKERNDQIKISIGLDRGFVWVLPGVDVFGDVVSRVCIPVCLCSYFVVWCVPACPAFFWWPIVHRSLRVICNCGFALMDGWKTDEILSRLG